MRVDQVDCPFCLTSKKIDLSELGTGASALECENEFCFQTFHVHIEYRPTVTVSDKPFHEEEQK